MQRLVKIITMTDTDYNGYHHVHLHCWEFKHKVNVAGKPLFWVEAGSADTIRNFNSQTL